jgi:hypothetical protein
MRVSVSALAVILIALPLSCGFADETESLTVGKITYLVPKNEISDRDRKKLTYTDCVGGSDCRRFEVTLDSGPAGKDNFEAGLKALEKMSGAKITPQAGPSDYQIYKFVQSNPHPSANTPDAIVFELYANDRLSSYFDCMITTKKDFNLRVCADKVLLADGNSAMIPVQSAQIEKIPDIEARIRRLVASFPVQGGK